MWGENKRQYAQRVRTHPKTALWTGIPLPAELWDIGLYGRILLFSLSSFLLRSSFPLSSRHVPLSGLLCRVTQRLSWLPDHCLEDSTPVVALAHPVLSYLQRQGRLPICYGTRGVGVFHF